MKRFFKNIKYWDWESIICISVIIILSLLLIVTIVLCCVNGDSVQSSGYKPQTRVMFINGKLTVLYF